MATVNLKRAEESHKITLNFCNMQATDHLHKLQSSELLTLTFSFVKLSHLRTFSTEIARGTVDKDLHDNCNVT